MVVPVIINKGTKLTISDFIPDIVEEAYSSICDQLPWFHDYFKLAICLFIFSSFCLFFIRFVNNYRNGKD